MKDGRVRKAAIIGSGPTGLVVAHALETAGIPRYMIDIFSRGQKSELYGAQFLHGEIPGLSLEPFPILVVTEGTMDQYREKVYESYRDFPKVPLEEFGGKHVGWDIRLAYDKLWLRYFERIQACDFIPGMMFGLKVQNMLLEYDLVFTTMSMRHFCIVTEHSWNSETVYAIGDTDEERCPVRSERNTVHYNGTDSAAWYRKANIHGYCTVEWPAWGGRRKPPVSGVVRVTKPLSTNCTCWPELIRVGRYGQWKKGVLVNHAYDRVMSKLNHGVQGVLF